MTLAAPAAALRPYVREYCGWFEHMAAPICRRELPTEIIPIIFNFGAPVRIFDANDPARWTDFDSFTTGPYDTFVLVGSSGPRRPTTARAATTRTIREDFCGESAPTSPRRPRRLGSGFRVVPYPSAANDRRAVVTSALMRTRPS